MYRLSKIFFIVLSLLWTAGLYPCTIGVIRADLTDTGRPMIWKTRDAGERINYPQYDHTGLYAFVGLTHSQNHQQNWAGINVAGFAILNALSLDLQGSSALQNGFFLTYALQNFATIEEFEAYLVQTNVAGRAVKGNFAVIDALGNGAMYEIANNEFHKYDVNNPTDAPNGYVIRTNFSMAGQSTNGIERFQRSNAIIFTLVKTENFSVQSLIENHFRDFSDEQANPYTIPFQGSTNGHFGYIDIQKSICNINSAGSVAIEGISTPTDIPVMWTLSGFPAVTPAIPFVPSPFDLNLEHIPTKSQDFRRSLMDISGQLYLMNTLRFYNENETGIWETLMDFEAEVRGEFYELLKDPDFEISYPVWLAQVNNDAYALMTRLHTSEDDKTIPIAPKPLLKVYPNPTTGAFRIDIAHQFNSEWTIEVFNVKGQLIHKETSHLPSTRDQKPIDLDRNLPSGVYLLRVSDRVDTFSTKLLHIK